MLVHLILIIINNIQIWWNQSSSSVSEYNDYRTCSTKVVQGKGKTSISGDDIWLYNQNLEYYISLEWNIIFGLIIIIFILIFEGFQILTDPPQPERPSLPAFIASQHDGLKPEEYFLSLGRNIHRLSEVPNQSQINVTRYRPRHVRVLEPVLYWYVW